MDNKTLSFADLGCAAPYLEALAARGFTEPMPVQSECFGPGLSGQDLLVQSRTGSGKTLAFGLPLMHRLGDPRHPQAIILTPTRELAQQVAYELRSVNSGLDMAQLVGGMSYAPQWRALSEGARVIVGTPGRVIDHIERGTLDLSHIRMVVLDECDEMLNMGFIEDVERILAKVPPGPQTYLFSATLPAPIASLAKRFLKDPHRLEMTECGGVAQHADISHTACLIVEHHHHRALANILLHDDPSAALIFTKMKVQTEEVAEALRNAGLPVEYLHGDLNQGARNRIMGSFKAGKLRFLVATDVAARGIDVEGLPLVVNMGIPTQFENYIHRTGRTGRAGSKGVSLSLVGYKESRILLAWARRGGLRLEWRAVPTPDEIRQVRSLRLCEKVAGVEAPAFESLAQTMLQARPAEGLVAALVSLLEDEVHGGFDIPEGQPHPTSPPKGKGKGQTHKAGSSRNGRSGRGTEERRREALGRGGGSRNGGRPDKTDKPNKPTKTAPSPVIDVMAKNVEAARTPKTKEKPRSAKPSKSAMQDWPDRLERLEKNWKTEQSAKQAKPGRRDRAGKFEKPEQWTADSKAGAKKNGIKKAAGKKQPDKKQPPPSWVPKMGRASKKIVGAKGSKMVKNGRGKKG